MPLVGGGGWRWTGSEAGARGQAPVDGADKEGGFDVTAKKPRFLLRPAPRIWWLESNTVKCLVDTMLVQIRQLVEEEEEHAVNRRPVKFIYI